MRSANHIISIIATQALGDAPYGVLVQAARLRRRVEMYQWVEESQTEEHHERDGSVRTETHYSYSECYSL